jgi:hypothetical protein
MRQTRCRGWFVPTALVLSVVSSAPGAHATGPPPPAPAEARAAAPVTPVAAGTPDISFARCHFQKTPPYEPRVRLECDPGEVVVAVFEDGVRCCALELK